MMAKQIGPKSMLIREAIAANPDTGNTKLAELLNGAPERKADKIKVTANDVAQQKQAMKKPGAATSAPTKPAANGRKRGRKPGRKASVPAPASLASSSPIDLIDRTLDLAQQCGGVAALKRLVDRLAEMQR